MNKTLIRRSERLYSFLLKLFPRKYRQEFEEEMQYVFSESLKDAYRENGGEGIINFWIRTSIDAGKSLIMQHIENHKGKQNITKRLIMWFVVVAFILLIPLVLTIINPHASINGGKGGGWDWEPGDFIFGFVVLFGASATYELVAKKMNNKTYRFAVGLAVLTSLILVWINAAVGIIGDDDDPNLLYFGALLIGFIGALIAGFKPRAMARAMFVEALALALVPVIGLFVWNAEITKTPPGVIGVFMLNSFFVLLFAVSGLLFRRASATKSKR